MVEPYNDKGVFIHLYFVFTVDLDEDINVSALLERLAEETQLPANCLELRGGFPPRELEIPSDGSIRAKEALQLQSNDLVTVQKKATVAFVSGGNEGETSKTVALVNNVESLPAASTVRLLFRYICIFLISTYGQWGSSFSFLGRPTLAKLQKKLNDESMDVRRLMTKLLRGP